MNNLTSLMECVDATGFSIVRSDYFKNLRPPIMTISKDEIAFSREAHRDLNFCEAIQILVNPESRQIIVKASPSSDSNSITWRKTLKTNYIAKFLCPKLTRPIFFKWNWDTNYKYRVDGRIVQYEKKPVLLFEFKDAKASLLKEIKKENE